MMMDIKCASVPWIAAGFVGLLFDLAFSVETEKSFSRPDPLSLPTIQIQDSVLVRPDTSITLFRSGRIQSEERFKKDLLHSEWKDGWQRVSGVLRWPRTLSPAVHIQVGFVRYEQTSKKIKMLCYEITNENGYVDLSCANLLGPMYHEFMRPAPPKNAEELQKHYNQGLTHSLQGEYVQALLEYEEALKYDPNSYQVHYNMGVVYVRLERYKEAVFAFERYLELRPGADNREETEGIIEQLREKLKGKD